METAKAKIERGALKSLAETGYGGGVVGFYAHAGTFMLGRWDEDGGFATKLLSTAEGNAIAYVEAEALAKALKGGYFATVKWEHGGGVEIDGIKLEPAEPPPSVAWCDVWALRGTAAISHGVEIDGNGFLAEGYFVRPSDKALYIAESMKIAGVYVIWRAAPRVPFFGGLVPVRTDVKLYVAGWAIGEEAPAAVAEQIQEALKQTLSKLERLRFVTSMKPAKSVVVSPDGIEADGVKLSLPAGSNVKHRYELQNPPEAMLKDYEWRLYLHGDTLVVSGANARRYLLVEPSQ